MLTSGRSARLLACGRLPGDRDAAVSAATAPSTEDRILQAELPGYRDYAARVRWRLLPGVW